MKRNLILSSLIIAGLAIGCGSDDNKKTTPKKPEVKAEVTETKKPKIEDIDYLKRSLDNAQTEEDHAVRNTVAGSLEMIAGFYMLKSANVDSKVSKALNIAKADMVALAKVDNMRMQAFNTTTREKLGRSMTSVTEALAPLNAAKKANQPYNKKLMDTLVGKIKDFKAQMPTAFENDRAKQAVIDRFSSQRNALHKTAQSSFADATKLTKSFRGFNKVSYKAVSSGQYARNAARGVAGKTVRLLVKGVAVVAIAEGATRIVMQFTDGIDWLSDYLPGNYVVRVLTGFTHSDRGDIPAAE